MPSIIAGLVQHVDLDPLGLLVVLPLVHPRRARREREVGVVDDVDEVGGVELRRVAAAVARVDDGLRCRLVVVVVSPLVELSSPQAARSSTPAAASAVLRDVMDFDMVSPCSRVAGWRLGSTLGQVP